MPVQDIVKRSQEGDFCLITTALARQSLMSSPRIDFRFLQRSTGELASYQQKMFRIDDHCGIAIAGLTHDARVLSFVPIPCTCPPLFLDRSST
jgi:hypothetical protein